MLNPDNPVADRKAALRSQYEALRAQTISLDLTRGNPSLAQLRLSNPMLKTRAVISRDGIDCRNYSKSEHLAGLPEARELCARYLGTNPTYTVVMGNSSLTLMDNVVAWGLTKGFPGWKFPSIKPKILCPAPGYDRHHTICREHDVEMIPIPMMEDGPNLAFVADALKDPSVVAMFCVPKYHNPTGTTFSDGVVRLLATMPAACPGFRLLWDNAYAMHDLTPRSDELLNIMRVVHNTPTEDRPIVFGSFSKVTFAGGGLAFMGMSEWNFNWVSKRLFAQTIGGDKLNQLRHVRFLHNVPGIRAHMRKHRRILSPKLAIVEEVLQSDLTGIANWWIPRGGYFVSVYMSKGKASSVRKYAAAIGLKLTGDVYPNGDKNDRYLRLSFTGVNDNAELRRAMKAFALCAQLSYWDEWPRQ